MIRLAMIAIFTLPALASGQVLSSTQHIFPWVVDGRVKSGATYHTEVVLSNPNSAFANCSLQLAGLSTRFQALNGPTPTVSVLNFFIFPFGYEILRTFDNTALASGYAVLNCGVPVYATTTFGLYSSDSAVTPSLEAMVPSSLGGAEIEYVFDARRGTRLGIAIANPYASPAVFTLTVLGTQNGVWALTLPAFGIVTRFLDELVPLQPNATGKVIISEVYSSRLVYSIGLKYSESAFTSVLPNILR